MVCGCWPLCSVESHIAKLKEATAPAPSFNSLTSSGSKSYSDDARRIFHQHFSSPQLFSMVKEDHGASLKLRLRAELLEKQGESVYSRGDENFSGYTLGSHNWTSLPEHLILVYTPRSISLPGVCGLCAGFAAEHITLLGHDACCRNYPHDASSC